MMKTAEKPQNSETYRRSPARSPQNLFVDVSTEILQHGRAIRFRAPGRSMHPTIKDEETITVEPVEKIAIKPGDIILYRSEGGVIAHRVVRIEKRNGTAHQFILRGDASGSPDAPVLPQQILGKVVCVERCGRLLNPSNWKAHTIRTVHHCACRLKRWLRDFFTL